MAETTDIQRLIVSMEANYRRLERDLARANQAATGSARKIERDFSQSNGRVVSGFNAMATRAASAGTRAAGGFRTTNLQVGNLAAQLNDIGVTLASGASPFQVMLQQGSQISQIFATTPGGVGGAMAAIRGSLLSMINPVSLLTYGFIGLGGVAIGWLTKALSSTAETEAITQRLTDTVSRLKDTYGAAAEAQERLTEAERLERLFQAQTDLLTTTRDLSQLFRELQSNYAILLNEMGGGEAFDQLERAATSLFQGLQTGTADVEAFRQAVLAVAVASDDPAVDEMARSLLEYTRDAGDAQDRSSQLERIIRILTGTATEADFAMQGLASSVATVSSAMRTLQSIAAPDLSQREEARAAFEEEMKNIEALVGTPEFEARFSAAQAELTAALERIAREEEQQRRDILTELETETWAGGLEGRDAALFALTQRQEETLAELRERNATQQEIDGAIAEFQAQRAQINARFDELDAGAADKGNRPAQRQANAVAELISRLREELSLLGASETEQRIANELRSAGAAATGEQRAAITALVEQIAAESEALEQSNELWERAEDAIAGALDRIIVQGDSAREVLADLLKQLASSALRTGIDALFGAARSATAGGGTPFLSALLSNFGGARALGGPILPGRSYLVGERGPELIVPRMPATVVPHGGGAGVSVTYAPTIHAPGATMEAVAAIRQEIANDRRAFAARVVTTVRDASRRLAI